MFIFQFQTPDSISREDPFHVDELGFLLYRFLFFERLGCKHPPHIPPSNRSKDTAITFFFGSVHHLATLGASPPFIHISPFSSPPSQRRERVGNGARRYNLKERRGRRE